MKKRLLLLFFIDAVLSVCCALASVCAVPTAYGAPFELGTLAFVVTLLALAVFFAFYCCKKTWPVAVVSSAAVLVYGWLRRRAIALGAKTVWFYAVSLLSLDFSFLPTPKDPEWTLAPSVCVTEFLVFSAAVIVIITALLLLRCKSSAPALVVPVLPFIPALIYTDSPPAFYTIILLLIYWAGALFGRELIFKRTRGTGLVKTVFVLMLAVLAMLLPRISPRERFEPVPFNERRGVFDLVGSLRDRMLSRNTASPKEYDLAAEGERTEDDSKAFSLLCSAPGAYALRTHSYGLYNSREWRPAEEYSGSWNSMLALESTQYGGFEYLHIRDAYSSERLTPYGFSPRYDVIPGESFIRTNGRTAYVWAFRVIDRFSPAAATAEENAYLRFAQLQYTLQDGPTKNRLLNVLEELTGSDEWVEYLQNLDAYSAAQQVADIVRNSADYSLNPGHVPTGGDFVEYFLLQNRRGYCVHFASATAALLQALGKPARYVVGYRAEIPEADVWYDVTRDSSHAWAEVYVKGVGWVPIESTAGFPDDIGFERYNSPGEITIPITVNTPRPDRTYRPTDETPEPVKTPRPTRAPREPRTASPKASESPGGSGRSAKKAILPAALALVLAALAWQLVGVFIRRRRERSFTQPDTKQAILAMLGYLGSIRRYGAVMPENERQLANEAAFSNHDMQKKWEEVYRLVKDNQSDLCRYKPLKRFTLRWLKFRI